MAPPFENGNYIHAYLGVAVALLLYVLYTMFSPKEEAFEEQITMGDLKKDPKNKVVDEDEVNEVLYKELDKFGPYEREMSGMLTFDGLKRLRDVINKHAFKKFAPRKEEMLRERIEYYKKQDWENYNQMIQKAAKEYVGVMESETKAALEFLDISI